MLVSVFRRGCCYGYPHFTDEEDKVKRCQVTHVRLPIWQVVDMVRREPRHLAAQRQVLSQHNACFMGVCWECRVSGPSKTYQTSVCPKKPPGDSCELGRRIGRRSGTQPTSAPLTHTHPLTDSLTHPASQDKCIECPPHERGPTGFWEHKHCKNNPLAWNPLHSKWDNHRKSF